MYSFKDTLNTNTSCESSVEHMKCDRTFYTYFLRDWERGTLKKREEIRIYMRNTDYNFTPEIISTWYARVFIGYLCEEKSRAYTTFFVS